MTSGPSRLNLRAFATSQPLSFAFLTVLTVLLFLGVGGLSRAYNSQQQGLAERWSSRGSAELQARHFAPAVNDFRTALLYSRDNDDYQFHLAQALMGEKKYDEAETYLTNLWERHPEDGEVNVELARIAATKGETNQAIRYYHDAIYSIWPADQEPERRSARFELIDLLLRDHAYQQAQSELIALSANLNDDPAGRAQLGDLFMQAQDNEHALAEYQLSLRGEPRNQAALAGAGRAAFELARYSEAARYLREAIEGASNDTASANLLTIADHVLQMDPYRQRITAAERERAVEEDFAVAGARLDACTVLSSSPGLAPWQALHQSWMKLKPQITRNGLRRDPDLVQAAMELVFEIEHQTVGVCGPPDQADTALLLIANMREGS
jgi:tetratricopeptide (TPR) repeat protein